MAAPTTIPTLLRWVLVDEDPHEEAIWIAKATPRAWLAHGQHVAVRGAPTAAGPIEFGVDSAIDDGHIDARLHLAAGCESRWCCGFVPRARTGSCGSRSTESSGIAGTSSAG